MGGEARRHDARDVFSKTATGDVGETFDRAIGAAATRGADGGQQRSQRKGVSASSRVSATVLSRVPRGRIAQSRFSSAIERRTSEKPLECTPDDGRPISDIAGGDIAARQDLVAFDGADGEAGEIVVAA